MSRQKTILRASSTALILLLRKFIPIKEICVPYISTISSLIPQARQDSQTRSVLMVYIELLENMSVTPRFAENSENLDRAQLISESLTLWLTTCGLNNVIRTLRSLHKLCVWIISQSNSNSNSDPTFYLENSERSNLIDKIWDKTGSFLTESVLIHENRSLTTDIEPYSDLGVDLTILVNNNSFFDHFCFNDRVVPEISAAYVTRILEYPDFCDAICELKWSQLWIRLVCLGCTISDKLNSRVFPCGFSQDEMIATFCDKFKDCSPSDVSNLMKPVVSLCRVVSAGNSIFKENTYRHVVKSVIRTCANLFRYFRFEKLYVKKFANSAGVLILDSLFPPCFGNFWERIPHNLLCALRLHSFDVSSTFKYAGGFVP